MTDQELRKRAEEEAASCRSPERDAICPYLQPGTGATYDDCPMRPHKCWHVSAKMWLKAWRESRDLYGDLWDMWQEEK